MTKQKRKRQVMAGVLASAIALGGNFAMQPAPTANAGSLGSIVGTVIAGARAHEQASQAIRELNDTEEGRQALFQKYKEEYGVEYNSPYQGLCESVMTRVTQGIAASDPSVWDKPFLWFINQNDSFNAFCSLGHVMSINRGLFNYLQNEDEIAVVIGHEMGHGMKNHVAKAAHKRINTAILANIAADMTDASAIRNIALDMTVKHVNQVVIGKADEWEADGLALQYITAAGYNPGAAAAVWQRFIDQSSDNKENLASEILNPSDHPSNSARRDKYAKSVKDYSGGHVDVKDGIVLVNGKKLVTPAAGGGMSSAERAYFVQGNLAAAYHNGHNRSEATADGNTVMLGAQPIMTSMDGDEAASVIADRLNQIK